MISRKQLQEAAEYIFRNDRNEYERERKIRIKLRSNLQRKILVIMHKRELQRAYDKAVRKMRNKHNINVR